MSQPKSVFFLTEPSEIRSSRRRDPFGFSVVADFYANLLAPGITNDTATPDGSRSYAGRSARSNKISNAQRCLGIDLRRLKLTIQVHPGLMLHAAQVAVEKSKRYMAFMMIRRASELQVLTP